MWIYLQDPVGGSIVVRHPPMCGSALRISCGLGFIQKTAMRPYRFGRMAVVGTLDQSLGVVDGMIVVNASMNPRSQPEYSQRLYFGAI